MQHVRLAKLRVAAWLVDWLLALGLSAMLGGVGWMLGFIYWMIRDGLFEGQSVGKRVMNLAVVSETGEACSVLRSLVRNVLWVIPVLNLVVAITGLHYLLHDPDGRHWGDRLAETQVVQKPERIEKFS